MIAKLLFSLWLPAAAAANTSYGILLLAHGGNDEWNQEVAKIAKTLSARAPTEVALGMADAPAMQAAADKLAAAGAEKIVAVPLFVNSASEVMDQTRYALGINKKPSEVLRQALARLPHSAMPPGHHMTFSEARVKTKLPVVMTEALDGDDAVAEVLTDRARALSRDILHETVVVVGHGPVDDKANAAWLKTMQALADEVRKRSAFKAAAAATIRDDSPAPVKAKAAAGLQKIVDDADKDGGRAIVVPLLIARGGIEEHIKAILKGHAAAFDGKTLCPHPAIARWAAEVAAKGAKMDNMRKFQ
jgi:sirohydrochlorin ferrochelatase